MRTIKVAFIGGLTGRLIRFRVMMHHALSHQQSIEYGIGRACWVEWESLR